MTSAPSSPVSSTKSVVLKNALWLVGAQLVTIPLSVLVNAVMGRYLGAEEFGYYYLAHTMVGFAILFVEFGQTGALPTLVAKDRSRAGIILGSAIAWRASAAPVVFGVLLLVSYLLDYSHAFYIALALMILAHCIKALTGALLDTISGFERTDVRAKAEVGQQLLISLLVIPILVLGGRLPSVLLGQGLVFAVVAIAISRTLRSTGVGRAQVESKTVRELVSVGSPFMFLVLISNLQPNIDALLMSKLAQPEAMGWYAVARKIVGILVFPVHAIAHAVYPTLLRLHAESQLDRLLETARNALKTTILLVVPAALGCGLFAEIGISLFNAETFAPAILDLQILSGFLFLVYFSMVVGVAITAMGKSRQWAMTQFACVGVSALLCPVLIPYFERTQGNGGIGVCIAAVVSEALMVGIGLWLAPRNLINGQLLKTFIQTLGAGACMVAVGMATRSFNLYLSAVGASIAYAAALWLVGGLSKAELLSIKSQLKRG